MAELCEPAAALVVRLRHTLVPAVLTPLTEEGELDQLALERYATAISSRGVGGLAAWAHTSRARFLSPAQRRQVLRVFRQATRVPIIAGVGAPHDVEPSEAAVIEATLQAAREALDGEADALMVFPPIALRDAPDRDLITLRMHRRLAEECDVPLLLFYLHGGAGGFPYPDGVLRELLALPQVAGIKVATLDAAVACQDVIGLVRQEFGDRLAITGEDRMYGPSLMWGADAALVGMAAAVPELSLAPLRAWEQGHHREFVEASSRLDRFAAATFRSPIEGYVQRMLWAAAWEGVIPAASANDPFGPRLPAGERELVERTLDDLFPAGPPAVRSRED